MATQTDLTKLKHVIVPSMLHFYYETLEDGTNVLRHIRVNQHTFKVPTDITIDGLPSESVGSEQIKTGGVGTRQIEDGGVGLADLSPEVLDAMEAGGTVASESDVRQIVTEYSPTQNT